MPGLAPSLQDVCWFNAQPCIPKSQDMDGKSLTPRRGFGGDRQAFQFHVEALHARLVKLDNHVARFKARGFDVQSVFADGKLKWAELVGCTGVNAIEGNTSVGGIGIEDQCSHTIPFVAGVGVAARLTRIFTGIRTCPPAIGGNVKRRIRGEVKTGIIEDKTSIPPTV